MKSIFDGGDMTGKSLIIGVLAVLLSGCSAIGPDFFTPKTANYDQWKVFQVAGVQAAPSELKDWWQTFNDPVLNQLITKAYEQNLSLQTAGLRVLEAKARLAQAVGNYYPTQQLSGDFMYSRESGHAASTAAGQTLTQDSIGFGATWEVDFWGKIQRGIESADAQLMASAASYDAVMVTLLGQVAQSYILVRTIEERLKYARTNVTVQRKSMELAKARFEAGTTSERDYQQALTQLHATEAIIPSLEKGLEQAKNTLSLTLGEAPGAVDKYLAVRGAIPAVPVNVAVGIPNEMLRRRPDVKAAEFKAQAECAAIGAVEGELYPSFALNGSFGFGATDYGTNNLSDIFTWDSRTGSVGPSLGWNILNYGKITNAVRAQDAKFQQAVSDYQNTVLSAQSEVQDALVDLAKSKEEVVYREKAVAAAKRTVELATAQYDSGATDYTTVINAQQSLLVEEDTLAVAKGAVPQALVSVYRALGGGWQLREGNDFVSASVKQQMEERTDWGDLLKDGDLKADPSRVAPSW